MKIILFPSGGARRANRVIIDVFRVHLEPLMYLTARKGLSRSASTAA